MSHSIRVIVPGTSYHITLHHITSHHIILHPITFTVYIYICITKIRYRSMSKNQVMLSLSIPYRTYLDEGINQELLGTVVGLLPVPYECHTRSHKTSNCLRLSCHRYIPILHTRGVVSFVSFRCEWNGMSLDVVIVCCCCCETRTLLKTPFFVSSSLSSKKLNDTYTYTTHTTHTHNLT